MDAVSRAGAFLREQGRPIDQARFVRHFEGGGIEELTAALARYQNPDGGFGHGLEVDIKAPDSNPFATELALLVCAQAGVPREHALLQAATAYLERTQDADGGWRFSEGVYAHELAPWFAGWEWPNLNPACAIAGLLKELGLGSARLHERVEALFQERARVEDLTGDDFYAARPYAAYFLPNWSHPQRELYLGGLLWWLIRQHVAGTLPDAEHFFAYVRTPETYRGARLPPAILAAELDRLEREQAADGGWPSPYDPGWRGWSTMQNLITLRAFGRA